MKNEEMTQLVEELKVEDIIIPSIVIERKALNKIPSYLLEKKLKKIVLVVDSNTRKAAGLSLERLLSNEGYQSITIELTENSHQQVIADEQTLIQLFAETPNDTDVILAVGAGTVHDIVRFVGYKMDIPFISVPTAASVDGFASKGAPLILRGIKNTLQTSSPIAIFADIEILKKSPKELTAAGFGDIIGKYTSLVDWKISSLIANEPYTQLAADITKGSLENCIDDAERIARHEDKGLEVLMKSLIESGLVMLALDFSRPASGSEHHLSHYWEMDLLKKGEKQLLHGAKVGVASTIIIDLYKQFIATFNIKDISSNTTVLDKIVKNWNEIKMMINELPSSETVRNLLEKIGGPTTPAELGIDDKLVMASLNEAFHLRNRCTGLLLINQFKKEDIKFPIDF